MSTNDREIFRFEKIGEGIYALDMDYLVSSTGTYTIDQINTALQNKDVDTLREISKYFYVVSGEYRRMVDYMANIHKYRNMVTPVMIGERSEMDKFDKYHTDVMDYMAKAYIEETCSFITGIVIRDGVFYGYERIMSDGSVVMQELPSKYCRSRYYVDGVWGIEFDMKFFDTFRNAEQKLKILNAMPEEFLTLYNEYKANPSGSDANWKMLSHEFARCHKFENSEAPFFCAVFPELIDLSDYKQMNKLQNKMDLYTVVVQKLPFDKDKGVLVQELEAQQLHKNAKTMISGDGVDVVTTPCETDVLKIRNSNDTGKSRIDDAVNVVYNTAGTSQVLFNSSKGTGSVGLDRGIKVDESVVTPLLHQYERWYNNKFNKYLVKSRNFNFIMQFLGVTIFNEKEQVTQYKELATLGYSKLAPVIASGIKQSTFINLLDYENTYLKLGERMIPVSSTHTQSATSGTTSKGESENGMESDVKLSDVRPDQRESVNKGDTDNE